MAKICGGLGDFCKKFILVINVFILKDKLLFCLENQLCCSLWYFKNFSLPLLSSSTWLLLFTNSQAPLQVQLPTPGKEKFHSDQGWGAPTVPPEQFLSEELVPHPCTEINTGHKVFLYHNRKQMPFNKNLGEWIAQRFYVEGKVASVCWYKTEFFLAVWGVHHFNSNYFRTKLSYLNIHPKLFIIKIWHKLNFFFSSAGSV